MDPGTLTLASDAIKILGPAIITAIVGYKAGKAQLDLKIIELDKNNEFKAREHVFEYYKSSELHNEEKYDGVFKALNDFIGMMMAADDDKSEDFLRVKEITYKFIKLGLDSVPTDLEVALRDFDKLKIKYELEYNALVEYRDKIKDVKLDHDVDTMLEGIYFLMDFYSKLAACSKLTFQHETEQIFDMALQSKSK